MEAKRLLRSRLVAARATRPAAEIAAAERALAEHGMATWRGLSSVATYAGVGTEPATRLLLDGLRAGGVAVVLPVLVESELRWAPYDGWDRLAPGPFGLLQPAGPRGTLPAVDLLVVPALAVDVRGHRLGRGRGHFDRALAVVEPSLVVAVVYDDEVLDEVPVEPHDRSVGAVLTPSGLRRLDS